MICEFDWEITARIATSLGLLVSSGVFIFQIIVYFKKKTYDESVYHLEAAIRANEEGIKMLSDGNNDRITWNTAARLISKAQLISSRVTDIKHRDIFEAKNEVFRKELNMILGYKDTQKTGAFFYGAKNPKTPIEEAAKESNMTQEYDHWESSLRRDISESALFCIWKAAQYPKEYIDQLDEVFPDQDLDKGIMRTKFPGMMEYLTHVRSSKKARSH